MKVWIHIDGVQEGPYELDSLPLDRMDANTPVWYEGMKDWEPAGRAVLTAPMFAGNWSSANAQPAQQRVVYATSAPEEQQKCPATYLLWSVLLTVLCCNPVGIVAIALGMNVTSKYRNYDFDGARRASETTAWWLMITIVTSLILGPLTMLMAL